METSLRENKLKYFDAHAKSGKTIMEEKQLEAMFTPYRVAGGISEVNVREVHIKLPTLIQTPGPTTFCYNTTQEKKRILKN